MLNLYHLLLVLFILINVKFIIETKYMLQLHGTIASNNSPLNNTFLSFSHSSNRHVINFYRDPDTFIETISDCIGDDNCRIIYHHIQKTGGKTVEYRMFQAFPFKPEIIDGMSDKIRGGLFNLEDSVGAKSCCWKKMFKRFNKYKKLFCPIKFMSYEVTSNQLQEIIDKCFTWNGIQSRYVVLVSFRDPEARTLSQIHQMCNKNFVSRRPMMQEACLTCEYNEETKEAFYVHTKLTNKAFEYVINTTYLNERQRVNAMTFQIDDIDSMFDKLKEKTGIDFPYKTANPEQRDLCDFGVTSEMFDGLAPSREIYRKLIRGL